MNISTRRKFLKSDGTWIVLIAVNTEISLASSKRTERAQVYLFRLVSGYDTLDKIKSNKSITLKKINLNTVIT